MGVKSVNKILYLASQSRSRQELLRQADIPFTIIAHNADEVVDKGLSLEQYVTAVARSKMDHVVMPNGSSGSLAYVLTADTMNQDNNGIMHGKPVNKDDAIAKIKALRKGGIVATAFCLDKKRFSNGVWHIERRIERHVVTSYVCHIPDHWIEHYLEHTPNYKDVSGAITVEGYGAHFLLSINGSYSSILGLPICEVRQALEELNFF